MGVQVPQDRTVKQPALAFCRNPECRKDGEEFEFEVTHNDFACPKCGADKSPLVGLKVLTHLLVPHESGPIFGKNNKRFAIACDEKRAYLATATNLEAATDQATVANCPGCLTVAKKLGLVKEWAFAPQTPQTPAKGNKK